MGARHTLSFLLAAILACTGMWAAPGSAQAQTKTIEVHYNDNGEISHTTEVSEPSKDAKAPQQPSKKLRNVSAGKVAELVRQNAGAATLVVVWAAYCPACRNFMPVVSRLAEKWREKGLSVVTFDIDESEAKFRRYAKRFQGEFHMMRLRPGAKGQLAKQLTKLGLAVPKNSLPIPFFALLDKTGAPVAAQVGGAPFKHLDAVIEKLLAN